MKRKLLVSALAGAMLLGSAAYGMGLEESFDTSGLRWDADAAHGGAVLTVKGPNGYLGTFEFGAGETLSLDFASIPKLSAGTYTYSLTVSPSLSSEDKVEMQIAREFGEKAANVGSLPSGATFSGAFGVAGGKIIDRNAEESVAKDQVILDDLIVDGSACIGQDCVNGESFGFDTIRLKENNLRIKFQDTSNSASFPSNDWQLTANDSTNGGANKFSIDDIDGGRTPFTLEASAPSHSLYVDDGGRVGLGTSTPVVELHVVSGDSPTLRLEQDGSSGFTPQTWDVAGNETNFFVRDATNGSRLPFKIRPTAPTNSLYVDTDGEVGFGTASPSAGLHVVRNTGNAASMLQLTNNGGSFVTFENTTSGDDWFFTSENAAAGRFIIDSSANAGPEMTLTTNGNLEISGGLITGTAGTCTSGTPCDGVFQDWYTVPSIEEHGKAMWSNSYLPAVGPTLPGQPLNITQKTTGILNELEHAHIYIEQLHERLSKLEAQLAEK